MKILVAGAGGFIGGHLVKRLLKEGHDVDAVDIKPTDDWHQVHDDAASYESIDVGAFPSGGTYPAYDEVYNLAADMGGMGFIENNKARCMLSVRTSLALLTRAVEYDWQRVFFASSACVYPAYRQNATRLPPLKESDAYPAEPEDGYGWEKLFSERLHRHFAEDFEVETRVARYHNVAGPHGTWRGGREKAPAAICRKVAEAVLTSKNTIEIWGDGEQTRSFMHVDDCVDGTLRLMRSNVCEPLNVGSAETVTINELVSLVETIADIKLQREYNPSAPQGVRGRSSDNTLCRELLDWEPQRQLANWLPELYEWVYNQVKGSMW